ncbi:MAG: phosphotransferase [Acidobacteriota bacterium]|nr:phosphotransferase [Acidobacteriota bacterium]
MPQIFKTSAFERLQTFLNKKNYSNKIERLTPDASTRNFFRIILSDKTAIACVYAETFDETLSQIDVTKLFLSCILPVAEIFEIDYERGIIIHQDFGDKILRDFLEKTDAETKDKLLNQAISLIAKIQSSTDEAFRQNSIASKLKFDEEKLLWELNFFKTHYFESFLQKPLDKKMEENLTEEFSELSRELETFAKVLTHRDFHAANLMLDDKKNLKIIDHQDARIGSIAYDLVSLVLDRITEIPSQEWLENKKNYFLNEREKLGLEKIKIEEFNYEFDLMTIQRCLKAIGTFSFQAANFDKTHFVKYIDPMFQAVVEASQRLQRFPNLQRIIKNNIGNFYEK